LSQDLRAKGGGTDENCQYAFVRFHGREFEKSREIFAG
jgi:hypothetical protein